MPYICFLNGIELRGKGYLRYLESHIQDYKETLRKVTRRVTKVERCPVCLNPRTVRYDYYKTGLLNKETVELLFHPQRVTSYSYDRNGNMTGITYPTGRTVTYTVEPYLGKPTAVTTTLNGAPQSILSNISYEPFGPLSGGTFGNGAAVARDYDLRYRLTSNLAGFED